MRRLAEEVGVVGGDQIDEGIDLVSPLRGFQQSAVVGVIVDLQGLKPLPQPPGHERLPVRPEPDPAVLVDEVGDEVVSLRRERGFGGKDHGGGRQDPGGSAKQGTPFSLPRGRQAAGP